MDKAGMAQRKSQATLITSLTRADAYPHPVSGIELFETHISWVILTGPFAYKIKKALRLEFLDFATLEARRHYCEEELRLNRRWAPDLYLDVVPICGTPDEPVVGGPGEAIEYAVRMLQFDSGAQLDRQLVAGSLGDRDMRELAATIARNHHEAERISFDTREAALADVEQPMRDNFLPLESIADAGTLATIRDWTEAALQRHEELLVERRKAGFVRECHGDLHLTNLVRLSSGIVPYDCVEFAVDLRRMDVISDLSFLVMDLVARDRQDLAFTLLNRYLEITGDYPGMTLLGLYLVYHCMIRAKVAAIRNTERSRRELEQRLAVALQWIRRESPILVAMHGYSGSGKTWLSSQLMAHLPAIRVRSDIERKRLFGLEERQSSGSATGAGIYTADASNAVYGRLFELAEGLLRAGFHVLLDASFLRRQDRRRAGRLAEDCSAAFVIVDRRIEYRQLVRHIEGRERGVSEADLDVLRYQVEHADALEAEERGRTVITASNAKTRETVDAIKALCQ